MASQLLISNWALDLIGEKRVDSLSDDSERAEQLSNAWDEIRDAALRARIWKFSVVRKSLAADTDTPAWGFDLQYSLDGDVVRVIQVDEFFPAPDLSIYRNSDTSAFHIEGRKILTNTAAPLKVRWAVNSVDVGLWDASFAKVMAADLAERINPRATESEAIQQRIERYRLGALREARAANAVEDPPASIADDSWIASRFQA